MDKKIPLLMAEDQTLMRLGMKHYIKTLPQYNIVAEVPNGEEVINFLTSSQSILPSLCILDIQMPKMDGLECARWIKTNQPQIKVVLLTSYDHQNYLEKAVAIRVDGYLLKDISFEQLKSALHMIESGYHIAPRAMMNGVSQKIERLNEIEMESTSAQIQSQLGKFNLKSKDIEIINP